MYLFVTAWLSLLGLFSPARAAGFGDDGLAPVRVEQITAKDLPDIEIKDKKGKSKADKEEAMSEAEKEAEKKRKEKLARVIVLKWPDNKAVDYTDDNVQRNVRSRIVRPDAQFYPEVDLYQNGRKVKDRTVVPAMQPSAVPEQNLQRVRQAVDAVSGIPWNGMKESEWGLKAQELRQMVELVWFIDKVEQREPLFLLYAQIGRAAENQNQNVPPFYEQIGNIAVNYYFYLAAQLAYQDPALMSKLTDQELNAAITGILQQLQQGAFPNLKIDFEQEGEDFDLEVFNESYELFINGIKTDPDDEGQMNIFLGRTDIYLKRVDNGHGLSERLEVSKLEDKIYFVRDTARKKMGVEFIEQLFLHPNECTPALDGDILNYLAIYAKIHEKAEIYIAVPQYGNPNRVWIWRYDRPSANLQLVGGGADGFPVRFALSLMGGVMYNGGSPITPTDSDVTDALEAEANDPDGEIDPTDLFGVDLDSAYIPLNVEFRAHYNRLMVALGTEAGFATNDASWTEHYWLPKNTDAEVAQLTDKDGDGVYQGDTLLGNERAVNRLFYLGISAVLGRDAGIGFGPRLGGRVGYTNLPHALMTTAHVGWAFQPPGFKNFGERVRPFVDIDGRAGAQWPFANSLYHTEKISVDPLFGITAGVGLTF